MNRSLSIFLGFSVLSLPVAAGAQTPRLTAAQAKLFYAAGGFPISADGRSPTNRCGKAASPRITFVDMNGDGRKEALFIDSGPCYQPDGRWYAITTQAPDGSWRRILEGAGTTGAAGTMANGWFVLTATSAGRTMRLHFNGTSYTEAGKAATVTIPAKPGAPAAPTAPVAQSGAARDTAIFRAAGFKPMRGHWESGCNDPSTGAVYDPGKIEQVRDLNGDGRPEAVVTEGGSYCYGNTGTAFWLVSQQANGAWKLIYNEVGIAEFLKAKGVGGWPDISVGGPGFCFPVVRWNGSAYVNNRSEYEGKPCRNR